METKLKEEAGLKVGNHQFRKFDGADAAFGARRNDYPERTAIPDQFYNGKTKFNQVFSSLFFEGGSLAKFGLKWKPEIDERQAMAALRALMTSFEPKHEIKEATVAWALSEWCDAD